MYSDINIAAGAGSPRELVMDIQSINQNIELITVTPKRSKIWKPWLGSNVVDYLYEPIDDVTASAIRTELGKALEENFEFRVVFQSVDVIPDMVNQGYFVEIQYKVPTLENQQVTHQFILNRM